MTQPNGVKALGWGLQFTCILGLEYAHNGRPKKWCHRFLVELKMNLCLSLPYFFLTPLSFPSSPFYSLPLLVRHHEGWSSPSRWVLFCSIFLTKWDPLHTLEMTSLKLAPDIEICLAGRSPQGIIFCPWLCLVMFPNVRS